MTNPKKISWALLALVLVFLLCCPSCATKQGGVPEVIPEPEPEAFVPPPPKIPDASRIGETEILSFAKRLQDTLEESGVKGALGLFADVDEKIAAAPASKLMQASLLLSDNQLTQAREITNSLISDNPSDTNALVLAALIAKASNDTPQKRTYIARVLEIDPLNSDANVELGDEQMLRKNYSLALRYYRKAAEGDSKNPAALFGMGKSSYYLGNMKDAESAFSAMLENDPKESVALVYLGKLASEKSNYKLAQEYIEKALKISPATYDYLLDYGQCLRNQGKFREAAAAWERAAKADPNYFLAFEYLGGVYEEMEEYDKSLANYNQVVRTNPDYYYAYEAIGSLAWRVKNWRECREAFSKAREYDSKNISYPLFIAATYFKEGNKAEAKKILDQTMRRMDKFSTEYSVVRLYFDGIQESAVVQKVMNETNRNVRGRLLFFIGLYYEINGAPEMARQYYREVQEISAPMFFEYRINEWALK
jgi:tetratricopeptide (TPR) repeat protein